MLSPRAFSLLLAAFLMAAPLQAQNLKVPVDFGVRAPTAVEGVVYFASGTKLYAVRSSDGLSVNGFPVEMTSRLSTFASLTGRPSVYFGNDGKGIYVYSTAGDVARVNADGSVAWVYKPAEPSEGMYDSMPIAVTSDGEVFSTINDGTGYQIIKLSQADGSLLRTSVKLTASRYYGTGAMAVQNGYVYLSSSDSAVGGRFIVLNASDLTVRAASDSGENPCVLGDAVFTATAVYGATNRLYKQNSVTLNPDPDFGSAEGEPGSVTIQSWGSTSLFPYRDASVPDGEIFVAPNYMSEGILVVNSVTGAKRTIATTNTGVEFSKGLVVVPGIRRLAITGIAYGSPGDPVTALLRISLDNPAQRTLVSNISGTGWGISAPVYDRATNRFFVGGGDGLYGFNAQ